MINRFSILLILTVVLVIGCAGARLPQVAIGPAAVNKEAIAKKDKLRVSRETVIMKGEDGKPAFKFITYYTEDGIPVAFFLADRNDKIILNAGGIFKKK